MTGTISLAARVASVLTASFRAALPRALETSGVFVISSEGREEAPARVDSRGEGAREAVDAYGDATEGEDAEIPQ